MRPANPMTAFAELDAQNLGSSGRRSHAPLAKTPFYASLVMCRKDAEGDGWDHTSEVRRARSGKQGGPKWEFRLLASVAAGDAWLLLSPSGPFVEQLRALMDASGFA